MDQDPDFREYLASFMHLPFDPTSEDVVVSDSWVNMIRQVIERDIILQAKVRLWTIQPQTENKDYYLWITRN